MAGDTLITWAERLADAVEQVLAQRSGRPEATYRVQFQKDRFTFPAAAAIVPYLHGLGVSHVYCSPYLKARPGSPHGYDIVDHHRLNPELGTIEDFAAFVRVLHEHGMGQIADIVPNHMGIATNENAWWNDVLENGPSSTYAKYFDIDWRPFKAELKNKVLLPVLGGQYGQVLESGQLQLEYRDGAFFLCYYEMAFPLEPRSYTQVLTYRLDELRAAAELERQRREEASALGLAGAVESAPSLAVSADGEPPLPDAEALLELESIITALEYLPDIAETGPDRVSERQREKEVVKGRLARLTSSSPPVAGFIERNVGEFNGDPDDPRSFDPLDELLNAQVYRLSHWRAASDEINYRRFFDINDLAALTMEEPEVFEDAHRLIFELLVRGDVNGLRIDHIDGLFDPAEYLRRLHWGYCLALGRVVLEAARSVRAETALASQAAPERAAGAAGNPGSRPVESSVRTATAAAGNDAGRVFPFDVDFDRFESLGEPPPWDELETAFFNSILNRLGPPDAADSAVREIVPQVHRPPLYVAVEKILEPDEQLPQEWPVAGTTGYDFMNLVGGLFVDPGGLAETVKTYGRFIGERRPFDEIAYQSKMLILRVSMSSELQLLTYRINRLSEQHRRTRDFTLNTLRVALREILACFPVYRTYISAAGISERDRHFLNAAVARAKWRSAAMEPSIFDFIRDTLLLEQPPELDERGRRERELFVGRFQQVTSPVMAKGVEDTAFYRYFPLVSLNEVGGSPAHRGAGCDEFHRENRFRQKHRPRSLIGTTTHDTKRSEDVRARISVLSEIPQLWRKAVNRWARLNRRFRRQVDGLDAPSRDDEYLFYQTLAGMWPIEGHAPHPKPAANAPRDPEPKPAGSAPREPLDPHTHRDVVERLQQYMEKATHEAKARTSWINPNPEYNEAVREFVARVLDDNPKNRFLPDFLAYHERLVHWGLYTALSQCLLKLAAPGVPDIYQGQELWDFSLVDPDNRRPVDFDLRRWLLAELQATAAKGDEALLELARHLAHNPRDNRLKLLVTWRMLTFRREHAGLFERGEYVPLQIEGPQSDHACAFAWRWNPPDSSGEDFALVIVPRLLARLTPLGDSDSPPPPPPLGPGVWHDTRIVLPDDRPRLLKNLFTGKGCSPEDSRLPLADVLADFPVAVLTTRFKAGKP